MVDVPRSPRMAAVFAVVLACSGEAPPAGAPSAPVATQKAKVAPVAEEEPGGSGLERGCVEPVAAEAIATVVRTWALVGTASERVVLGGVGGRVFVAAGARLYDAAAGEALVASSRHGLGLPRKPVSAVFGVWPADAWLVSAAGAQPRSGGEQGFELWRWQETKWSRQNKQVLLGDALPEVYRWTEGRVLGLRCEERPKLSFESFGAEGPLPPTLKRLGATSMCPERFFALPAGDVFAIDDLSAPELHMMHWCASCGAPAVEAVARPRPCEGPPIVSMGRIQVPATPREAIFAVHAYRSVTPEEGGLAGSFLARRVEGVWSSEAVPGGASVEAIAVGTDGATWLATDLLLRRDLRGKWERHGLPAEVTAPIVQLAVTDDDEVWIVVEAGAGAPLWSVYRTGSASGVALDLDRGKPLAPATPEP